MNASNQRAWAILVGSVVTAVTIAPANGRAQAQPDESQAAVVLTEDMVEDEPGAISRAREAMSKGQYAVAEELFLGAIESQPYRLSWSAEFAEMQIKRSQADSESGDHRFAARRLAECGKLLTQIRIAIRLLPDIESDQLAVLLDAQKQIEGALQKVDKRWKQEVTSAARLRLQRAQELYAAGKGNHWYSNDNEFKFKEALWQLDATTGDLNVIEESVRRDIVDLNDTIKRELGQREFDAELHRIRMIQIVEPAYTDYMVN